MALENPKFKLKIGTIDKKTPRTFYIEGSTFITPTEKGELTYKEKFNKIYKEIGCGIEEMRQGNLNNALKKTYIINIDVADERMKVGKKSYFTFQYFLQQEGEVVSFQQIVTDADSYIGIVLKRLEEGLLENGFEISKTK